MIRYEGYVLEEDRKGWRSTIDGRVLRFDTAGQWKQYIDLIKKEK